MTPGARELSIAALEADEVSAWRELASKAVDPNPFFEPDFLLPANRHVSSAPDRLLVVGDGERWTACLPLTQTRWHKVLSLPHAGDPTYGFLATPLIARDAAEQAAARLVEAMRRRAPLVFQRLGVGGPFEAALAEAIEAGTLSAIEQHRYERALLLRSEEDRLAHLAPHHRRDLKRMARRLAEDVGGALSTRDRAGDPAAVETFLELELRGWKGRARTALASDPGHAEFFRELCASFARAGRLQLLELGTADRPVAMKCNLRAADGLFSFKIAFDEDYARWSPGMQLEVENMYEFDRTEAAWMDSCADPDNTMINRLWPGRRQLSTAVLGAGGLRPREAAVAAVSRVSSSRLRHRLRRGAAESS